MTRSHRGMPGNGRSHRPTWLLGTAAALAASALMGCQDPPKRLNAPPHGDQAEKPDLQGTFVYMTDNALLESMSIADYHFLPNRPLLTTLGKQRLYRLAALVEEYGGEIRFNTTLRDDPLADRRAATIVEYLQELGVDTEHCQVVRDRMGPEQTTKSGEEAILIKLYEGTYRPRRGSGTSGGGLGTSGTGLGGGGGMMSGSSMGGSN
jgi:hypothetical protein